jgi:hypothetical protein
VQRLQWREVALAELVDALRRRQVLEAVLAQIPQAVAAHQRGGGGRKQHLTAVSAGGNSGRAVDIDADVVTVDDKRRAGMQADAEPQPPVAERLGYGPGGGEGADSGRVGDHEGVALGAYLDAALSDDRITDDAAVLAEGARVLLGAEPLQQLRRALDVAEKRR